MTQHKVEEVNNRFVVTVEHEGGTWVYRWAYDGAAQAVVVAGKLAQGFGQGSGVQEDLECNYYRWKREELVFLKSMSKLKTWLVDDPQAKIGEGVAMEGGVTVLFKPKHGRPRVFGDFHSTGEAGQWAEQQFKGTAGEWWVVHKEEVR